MTHSKRQHNLYTTRQEVKSLSAPWLLCPVGTRGRQVNSWQQRWADATTKHTHTHIQPSHRSAHREQARTHQPTTTLEAPKVKLRSRRESTSVCLVSAKWMCSACECNSLYTCLCRFWWSAHSSLYISAVRWVLIQQFCGGHIKVMHLFGRKCTVAGKKHVYAS